MTVTPFGRLSDGTAVDAITLTGGTLSATILTYGAAIQDLLFNDRRVVVGLATLAEYVEQTAYLGAIAGRYANRIRDGRFTLDGTTYQLACNNGPNHLHGGLIGFDKRVWGIASTAADSVTLTLTSADGDEGYPGEVAATCTYRIVGSTLRIELGATTSKPTILNLAAHSYFNLDQSPTTSGHLLMSPATRYLPVDDSLIPTGEQAPVAGTPFDFRAAKRLGATPGLIVDHNLIVRSAPAAEPELTARVTGPQTGITLEVWSTEPGVQVYDGSWLDMTAKNLSGLPILKNGGFCLEPQRFPDSPNHPEFPTAVLKPGDTYRQITEYRFS